MKGALLGFVALAVGGRRLGKVSEAQARGCYAAVLPTQLARYADQADMAPFNAILPQMVQGQPGAEAGFVETWHAYLASHGF